MVNPYDPKSREYALLNNLIELVDGLQDYAGHCEPDGKEIKCSVINDLIAAHTKIHEEILNPPDRQA